MGIKLKTRKRQSGKTHKLLGKMFHHETQGNNPIFISYNNHASRSALKRFNQIVSFVISDTDFVTHKEWFNSVNPKTKTILLDDYEYYNEKVLKDILKYAKRNNVKVIGYSSKEADMGLFPEAEGEVE